MGNTFSFEEIDALAEKYQVTGDERLEERFIRTLDPYLFTVATTHFTKVLAFNVAEDWFQELRIESLRLFREWKPCPQLKFNYLLRRQIGNFCISSYIHAVAKKRNQILERDLDISSLQLTEKDVLEEIENRELLEKVYNCLKEPERLIFTALWEGFSGKNIEQNLNVTPSVISKLKRKVREVVYVLQTDKPLGDLNGKKD